MTSPTSMPTSSGGSTARLRRQRLTPDVVLAVALPVVCAVVLVLVRPAATEPASHPPARSELATASVVCPSAMSSSGGADLLGVTTLGQSVDGSMRGDLEVGLGEDTTTAEVRTGRVTAVRPGSGPAVVTGLDKLAPGLVAGRSADLPLAATDCAPPAAERWFTALGSGATHSSVIELVNPNPGPAVADISVWSPNGLLDVPRLRGVTVPGGTGTRIDLGEIVPRRGELAVGVATLRGLLAAGVVDTYDELGGGVRASDWLPGQAAPAPDNLLLGLDRGPGERTLVLGNPGEDELRAEVRVVTPRAVFAPAGAEPIRVAPGTAQKVNLSALLEEAADKGAIGLLVQANGAITATLRQVVDGDLSLLAPAEPVSADTAAVVPPGRKRLLLAAPDAVGVATVTARALDGRQLLSRRVELTPDTGANIELPEDATLVTVTPERTTVRAAVLIVGSGTAVVGMRELVRTGLVPDVRPGLP